MAERATSPAAETGAVAPAMLAPEDVARGWLTGTSASAPPVQGRAAGRSPAQALEDVMVEALSQPPCLVLFSGGRDSSLMLGAASAVALRQGLPLPVAVTERYGTDVDADESAWQEAVIHVVKVEDWVRLTATEAADLLGTTAQASLARFGLRWPPLAHTRAWFLPQLLGPPAADGTPRATVVDGEGGDELLAARRLAPLVRLARTGRVGPHGAAQLVRGLAPRPLRRWLTRKQIGTSLVPWLRPAAAEAFADDLVRDAVAEPLRWDRAVPCLLARRAVHEGLATLDTVVAAAGARSRHPLLDPAVVDAVAEAGGPVGFAGRADALRQLFGAHLPAPVGHRSTKAHFNRVVFGPRARAFARTWDGSGVSHDLVAVERLRAEWDAEEPSALSFLALHAAWLASQPPRDGHAPV
jgi:hypothetical protein